MTLAELHARMHPSDVAAAKRLAEEAPPLTPSQQATLITLLGGVFAEACASKRETAARRRADGAAA